MSDMNAALTIRQLQQLTQLLGAFTAAPRVQFSSQLTHLPHPQPPTAPHRLYKDTGRDGEKQREGESAKRERENGMRMKRELA